MVRELAEIGVILERANKRHARELARIMREDDKVEIMASGGLQPEQAIRASINRSAEAWAMYAGEDLLIIFGVADGQNGWAVPWVLSSTHVPRYGKTFWRATRLIFADIRTRYPNMVQMVHARYAAALRWVERLGFRVESPVRFGRANTLFCRISVEKPNIILTGGG